MEQDALFSDSLICELYHGSLSPEKKKIFQNAHIYLREKRVENLSGELLASIPKEQRDRFQEIMELHYDLKMLREAEVFQYAFKLGAKMMLEVTDKSPK